MFRSEDMCLNQIMFAKESMWDTMNHLANTEKVMFTLSENITPHPSNSLALYGNKMTKRCEELISNISAIEKMMKEFEWPISEYRKSAKDYMSDIDAYCEANKLEGHKLFEQCELELTDKYKSLEEFFSNYNRILEQRVQLLENQVGLKNMEELVPFNPNEIGAQQELTHSRFGTSRSHGTDKKFHSLIGLIPTANLGKLQKLLFRISRENILLKSKTLDPINDLFIKDRVTVTQKTLVFILFPRTEKEVIISKIDAVLKLYDFVALEFPGTNQKLEVLLSIKNDLEDNKKILVQTQTKLNSILESFSQPKILMRLSHLNVLKLIIKREQIFAKNLIYIEEKDGFYQLMIWVPLSYNETLKHELDEIRLSDNTFIKPKIVEVARNYPGSSKTVVPSYFKLNNFTRPFQLIVDTYGVPKYKEANPGLFTIISFPFLFGLMFGDLGHGFMLFVAGIYLCCFMDNKISMLNDIKYLILLMGFFAMYAGLIYNEFFSVPFVIQPSCYELTAGEQQFQRKDDDCTYAFGLDWVWAQSANETTFINSFKMKFSIVIGVIQMLLGIFLKGLNGLYFDKKLDIWFEAIPQFLFLALTFGYMSFCIIIKWLTNWEGKDPVSIIQLFINFITVTDPLYATAEIQQTIQIVFLSISVFCVFLMLLPKPLILNAQTKNKSTRVHEISQEHNHNLIGHVS